MALCAAIILLHMETRVRIPRILSIFCLNESYTQNLIEIWIWISIMLNDWRKLELVAVLI